MPPLVIAYAVLVDQVFDLRVVLRQALRYFLARTSLTLLIALPFVGLGALLFNERHRSLAEIASAGPVLALGGLTLMALALAAVVLLVSAVRDPRARAASPPTAQT